MQPLLRTARLLFPAAVAACCVLGGARARAAQDAPAPGNALAAMERLVGGYWHTEGGRPLPVYQAFEWGPSRRVITIRQWLAGADVERDTVRTEGFYYWHPAKKQLAWTAVGPAGELFEGEVSFDADGWTSDFRYHTAAGSAEFRDTARFTDRDSYAWTLYRKSPEGMVKQLEAVFKRKAGRR